MNDGGPAFPVMEWPTPESEQFVSRGGMTLRDWLAGQAMAGMSGNVTAEALNTQRETSCDYRRAVLASYEIFARRAYALADAMLSERENQNAEADHQQKGRP